MAPRSELLLRPPNRADWARGPTGPRGSRRRCCRPNPNLTLNSKKPPTHAHLPSTKKRVHPLSSVRYDAAAAADAAARRRRSGFSGRRLSPPPPPRCLVGVGAPLGEGGRGEGQGPPWNAAAKPRHPPACAEASESAAASSGCTGPSRRRRWQLRATTFGVPAAVRRGSFTADWDAAAGVAVVKERGGGGGGLAGAQKPTQGSPPGLLPSGREAKIEAWVRGRAVCRAAVTMSVCVPWAGGGAEEVAGSARGGSEGRRGVGRRRKAAGCRKGRAATPPLHAGCVCTPPPSPP